MTPSAAPDWASLSRELTCPLCDYNLRGLTEPRCPECGFCFAWNELLSPDKIRHPYLFEHYPRRSAWSFVMTFAGALRPKKFWTVLRPTHELYPKRLVKYWLILAVIVLLGPLINLGRDARNFGQAVRNSRQWYAQMANQMSPQAKAHTIKEWGSLDNYIDAQTPKVFSMNFVTMLVTNELAYFRYSYGGRTSPGSALLARLVTFAFWPWTTLMTLLVFQLSMRRAKVRAVHVMRCAVYACDFFWLAAILSVAVLPALDWIPWLDFRLTAAIGQRLIFESMLVMLLAGICTWRLWRAYRLYLQFPHPLATVATSQVIVILIAIIVSLNV
ncbi:MAG TPA: hypothetical protein VF669_09125 [Tepidisphaeraceae bacterium]|jgi:Sec-independent protein translocase protein TatA